MLIILRLYYTFDFKVSEAVLFRSVKFEIFHFEALSLILFWKCSFCPCPWLIWLLKERKTKRHDVVMLTPNAQINYGDRQNDQFENEIKRRG